MSIRFRIDATWYSGIPSIMGWGNDRESAIASASRFFEGNTAIQKIAVTRVEVHEEEVASKSREVGQGMEEKA